MAVHCNLDLDKVSYSTAYTPSLPWLPLALEATGYFVCRPQYFTRREGVETYLLLYTHSGEGIIETAAGRFALPAGTAAILDGRVFGHYATGEGGMWEMSWVHFGGTAAAAYVACVHPDGCRPIALRQPEAYANELAALRQLTIAEESPREDGRDLQLCDRLTHLLTELTISGQQQSLAPGTPYTAQIREAVRYLQRHYGEELRIADVADVIHLSRFHFSRQFKLCTGLTPCQYLMRYRVDRAKQLLLDGHRSIAEVASLTGFSDADSLTRGFRQWTGDTPRAYRGKKLGTLQNSSRKNKGLCHNDEYP